MAAALQGKQLLVSGSARLTRIDFMREGQPSGKYYYQTHVVVGLAEQLRIVD